jgi:hypothetical protein
LDEEVNAAPSALNHADEKPSNQKLRQDLQDEQGGLAILEQVPNGEAYF